MGYTHYWYIDYANVPPDAFGRTLLDAKRLIEASVVCVAGWDGTGSPTLDEGLLSLNGCDGDDFETFRIAGSRPDTGDYGWECAKNRESSDLHHWYFDCCKTGHRPYDELVCAILIRAAQHYGTAIQVSSDGWWDPDWMPGRELVRQVFGESPECPFPREHQEAEGTFG